MVAGRGTSTSSSLMMALLVSLRGVSRVACYKQPESHLVRGQVRWFIQGIGEDKGGISRGGESSFVRGGLVVDVVDQYHFVIFS